MREHANALLADTCKIESRIMTMDSIGGWSETWTARGSAIPCRLAAVTSRMGMAGVRSDQYTEDRQWMLTVAHDQTVEETDRVTVGGNVYQVRAVNDDDTEILLKRVVLERAD